MKINELGDMVSRLVDGTSCPLQEGTPLHHAAQEVLEMARAYCNDGWEFFGRGDLVNALAAFTYAMGWMDAGCSLGMIMSIERCSLPRLDGEIPAAEALRLTEKTDRYHQLLEHAIELIGPAPDPASILHQSALDFQKSACTSLQDGVAREQSGDQMNALSCFSYGFAWLDTGVRIGLFCIAQERELFTI
jgi:uncharacterized protein